MKYSSSHTGIGLVGLDVDLTIGEAVGVAEGVALAVGCGAAVFLGLSDALGDALADAVGLSMGINVGLGDACIVSESTACCAVLFFCIVKAKPATTTPLSKLMNETINIFTLLWYYAMSTIV